MTPCRNMLLFYSSLQLLMTRCSFQFSFKDTIKKYAAFLFLFATSNDMGCSFRFSFNDSVQKYTVFLSLLVTSNDMRCSFWFPFNDSVQKHAVFLFLLVNLQWHEVFVLSLHVCWTQKHNLESYVVDRQGLSILTLVIQSRTPLATTLDTKVVLKRGGICS